MRSWSTWPDGSLLSRQQPRTTPISLAGRGLLACLSTINRLISEPPTNHKFNYGRCRGSGCHRARLQQDPVAAKVIFEKANARGRGGKREEASPAHSYRGHPIQGGTYSLRACPRSSPAASLCVFIYFWLVFVRRILRCDTGFGKSCSGSMTYLPRRSLNMLRGVPAK
jgi:hypothetical protein